MAVFGVAKRITFVVGTDRKILHIEEGSDALDPSGSIASCPLHKPVSK